MRSRTALGLAGLLFLAAARGPAQQTEPAGGPFAVRAERHQRLAMRDGTLLAIDIYRPDGPGVPARSPVILIRTPYGKHNYGPKDDAFTAAQFFVSHGFAVAIGDVRGKFASAGDYAPSGHDDVDGYDTIDWLARQPWSSGRIGMFGCSYMGDVQIFAAGLRHPALQAIVPQASGSAVGSANGLYRQFGVRVGGAVDLAAAIGWFAQHGAKAAPRLPDTLGPDAYARAMQHWSRPAPARVFDHARAWRHLPTRDALADQDWIDTDFARAVGTEPGDPWWTSYPYMTDAYVADVPALFVNSWYDFGADMTLFEFNHFRRTAATDRSRRNQFAVLGPATHCQSEAGESADAHVGNRPVGDTRFDYWGLYRAWFDHWLKEVPNGVETRAPVTYYAMGANRWRSAMDWPISGTRYESFFLDAKTGANGPTGDGRLQRAAPTSAGADGFRYDPADPVPSLGGALCCTGSADARPGAFDQRPVEARGDVLTYTSEALGADLDVTGPVEVVLHVSSSAPDTDFTAKLVDVEPDGRAWNVLESILRLKYRAGRASATAYDPGSRAEIRITLGVTSNTFRRGHRIRLEISSSNFPRFDRNLNTGTRTGVGIEAVPAANRVFWGPGNPSRLILPVVPTAGAETIEGHRTSRHRPSIAARH